MRWLLLLVAIMVCGCESKYDRAKNVFDVESTKLERLKNDYDAANETYEKMRKVAEDGFSEIDAKLQKSRRLVDRTTYESLEKKSDTAQQQTRTMLADEHKRVRDIMHAIGSQQRIVNDAKDAMDKAK